MRFLSIYRMHIRSDLRELHNDMASFFLAPFQTLLRISSFFWGVFGGPHGPPGWSTL